MRLRTLIILFILLLTSLSAYFIITAQTKDAKYLEEAEIYEHNKISYSLLTLKHSKQIKKSLTIFQDLQVYNQVGDSYQLKTILDSSTKLIYRFKESSCNSCYENQLAKLKEFSKKIGAKTIVLLVSFKRLNDLKILTITYDIKFPIYNVDEKLIRDLPLEEYIEPYHFIVDPKLNSYYYFSPDKTLPDLTNKYFEDIIHVFSNK